MKKSLRAPIIFSAIFLIFFLIKAILVGNYEFLGYWSVLVILFVFIIYTDKKFNYPPLAVWLFSIWAILHMSGGLIYFGKTKLYDLVLIPLIGDPYFILRYDQLIHAYCYFAIGILTFFICQKYFKKQSFATFLIVILATLGVSAINEIIEFSMVVFADAGDAVGGYTNNMLDLVFNLIGAVVGVLVVRKIN